MIRCLHITNLAIIREATLELGAGLNLLTGETGAGKSILVDALSLALGGRATTEMIRAGAERASVEVEFDITGNRPASDFLSSHGYPREGDTVVARREIGAAGRGRAFIGGVMAPVSDLRMLAENVVELHAQHQHQALLTPANHRALLDQEAGLEAELAAMAGVSAELKAAASRLHSLREGEQRVAQRIDMLRFQVQEIEAAGVQVGEREALRSERDLLRSSEAILRSCGAAYEALYDGESSALARLAEGLRAVGDLTRFEPGLLQDVERVETAAAEIEELALRLRDFPSRLSADPDRLQQIEDRLMLLESLLRKYAPGGDEEGIRAHYEAASEELSQLTGGGESVSELEARVENLRASVLKIAQDLSAKRHAAALALERRIEAELGELAMKGTRFAIGFSLRTQAGSGIRLEGEEVAVDATGYDVVEFLLSANRGEALRPVAAIASGGELSRMMLALEVVLHGHGEARTLVFDEVDAGIGGAVAEAVARKLRMLSRSHQVICVTHLPQIASYADRHVVVSKRRARGRTEVDLDILDEAGRVRELARMLAGEKVTQTALRHAASLRARGVPG